MSKLYKFANAAAQTNKPRKPANPPQPFCVILIKDSSNPPLLQWPESSPNKNTKLASDDLQLPTPFIVPPTRSNCKRSSRELQSRDFFRPSPPWLSPGRSTRCCMKCISVTIEPWYKSPHGASKDSKKIPVSRDNERKEYLGANSRVDLENQKAMKFEQNKSHNEDGKKSASSFSRRLKEPSHGTRTTKPQRSIA